MRNNLNTVSFEKSWPERVCEVRESEVLRKILQGLSDLKKQSNGKFKYELIPINQFCSDQAQKDRDVVYCIETNILCQKEGPYKGCPLVIHIHHDGQKCIVSFPPWLLTDYGISTQLPGGPPIELPLQVTHRGQMYDTASSVVLPLRKVLLAEAIDKSAFGFKHSKAAALILTLGLAIGGVVEMAQGVVDEFRSGQPQYREQGQEGFKKIIDGFAIGAIGVSLPQLRDLLASRSRNKLATKFGLRR